MARRNSKRSDAVASPKSQSKNPLPPGEGRVRGALTSGEPSPQPSPTVRGGSSATSSKRKARAAGPTAQQQPPAAAESEAAAPLDLPAAGTDDAAAGTDDATPFQRSAAAVRGFPQ